MTSLVDLWDRAVKRWPIQPRGKRTGAYRSKDHYCALGALACEIADAPLILFGEIERALISVGLRTSYRLRISEAFDRGASRAKVRALLAEIDREMGVAS